MPLFICQYRKLVIIVIEIKTIHVYEALRLPVAFNPGIHHNDKPFIVCETMQDPPEISEEDPDVAQQFPGT